MKKAKECIDGTIIPLSWSKSGAIRRVGIYTSEGEDILLDHHFGPKLIRSLINKEVRIFGRLFKGRDELIHLDVKRILRLRRLAG